MSAFLHDLRYGLRMLARNPGFTAVAVLALALGIGANTAIFSLVNAVILRLLPVRDPQGLVLISVENDRGFRRTSYSYPFYQDVRDRNQVLAGLIARFPVPINLSAEGNTERVLGDLVTGNYFRVLGVQPALGRLFTDEDDRAPNGHPVCVLGYGLWQRRFGRDPNVIGKTVVLNGRNFTVLGVMPPAFTGLDVGVARDICVPMMMQEHFMPHFPALSDRNKRWLQWLARLKLGVSLEQARAGLEVTINQIAREHRMERGEGGKVMLSSGSQGPARLRRVFERPLLALMGVVGLVLLIACANVAGLLLARATARRREVAVRLALGAGRWRLMRQLLTEGALLSLTGGALGALLSSWLVTGMLRFGALFGPLKLDLSPDWRVVGFAFAACLLTTLLFGLAPAWQAARTELAPALKDAAEPRSSRLALRKLLVAGQIALSLVLLAGAGLLASSLRNLKSIDAGFVRENIVLMTMDPAANGYREHEVRAFYDRLMERVETAPGVRSASLGQVAPLSGAMMTADFTPQGYQPKPGEEMTAARNSVGPRYFATMRIPLLLGRDFTAQDRQGAPKVAIINETAARRFWPGENPVGKRFQWGVAANPAGDIEVVGVVRDFKHQNIREQVLSGIYTPVAQERASQLTLHVRTPDPVRTTAALHAEIKALDRNLPVYRATTMEAQLDEALATERLMAWLSASFSGLAVLLAAVGLYGVMAHAVGQRTREIGVRMALGAQRGDVLRLMLRESALLVAVGLALGLGTGLAATRVISSFLFGLNATDARIFALAVVLLGGVALLAGYLPARRATRVDPAVALRYE